MIVQVEKLEHNMAKLTIEVEASKFDAAMKKAYNKKKGSFNLPGLDVYKRQVISCNDPCINGRDIKHKTETWSCSKRNENRFMQWPFPWRFSICIDVYKRQVLKKSL